MTPLKHRISVDLIDKNHSIPQVIHCVQNDVNSRAVEVTLLQNGAAYEAPVGFKFAFAFEKKDRTNGFYDKLPNGNPAISVAGNIVTATFAPQVLTCPGKVAASIVLIEPATLDRIATFPFTIKVEKDPSAGQSVSNDYYAFSTMAQVGAAVEGWMRKMEDEKEQFLSEAEAALSTIRDVAAESAPPIVAEATGSAITLNDASNRPLQGLTVYGKTTQDGTPAPDAPVELVNVGEGGNINVNVYGKNLFGGVFGTRYPLFIPAGTAIVASTAVGDANSYLYLFRADGSTITYASVMGDITAGGAARKYRALTLTEDVYAVLFQTNDTGDYQIELGSVATAYETYKASQTLTVPTPNGLPGLPVTSGGNYTDSRGQQWICDTKDLSRGVLVKRIAELVLTGTEAWVYSAASYVNWAYAVLAADAMAVTPVMCTHYVGVSGGSPAAGQISITAAGSVVIKADNIQSKEDVKVILAAQYAAGTPVKVRYVLAEPVETPMDDATLAAYAALHTNKPNTTITNDAGAGMQVEYVADTKAYIDNKFAALTAAMMA